VWVDSGIPHPERFRSIPASCPRYSLISPKASGIFRTCLPRNRIEFTSSRFISKKRSHRGAKSGFVRRVSVKLSGSVYGTNGAHKVLCAIFLEISGKKSLAYNIPAVYGQY
jgi:hypothetical protein